MSSQVETVPIVNIHVDMLEELCGGGGGYFPLGIFAIVTKPPSVGKGEPLTVRSLCLESLMIPE